MNLITSVILKPGGYTFHEHNPFFSFNEGHVLCTLELMWGHVRLSITDFQKYLKQFRPFEYDLAIRFYIENYLELNEKNFVKSKNNFSSLELIDLVNLALYIGLKKTCLLIIFKVKGHSSID